VEGKNRKRSKMSIENFIKDAELLWKNDRKEGAFIMTLIAVASTARKRYPHLLSIF
jgi:hypothetical protein